MPEGLLPSLSTWRERLAAHLLPKPDTRQAPNHRRRHLLMILTIFLLAAGVRLLHLQDKHFEIVNANASLAGVHERYKKEAERVLDKGGWLFPSETPKQGDARLIVHPPGYTFLLIAGYKISSDPRSVLWTIQIVGDALAAVMVFLIAGQFLNRRIAFIAGLLVAIVPQLAYYSLLLLPDALAVLPVLFAIYFAIRAIKDSRLINILIAGAMLGVSCWFRANGLLLSLFLAVVVFFLSERARRWRYAGALILAAVCVIAPITLRNFMVFKHFVPVSIGAGLNFVEGLGDYDTDGTLGMPRSDRETRFKDAEWHNRPDYAGSLWRPDGIERDRYRTARALEVMRAKPFWFAGVMFRRAGAMLRYNDSLAQGWPADTSNVQVVSRLASFNHSLPLVSVEEADESQETTAPPTDTVLVINGSTMHDAFEAGHLTPSSILASESLLAGSETLSPQTAVALSTADDLITVEGNGSEYADQFVTPALEIKKQSDYLLTLTVKLEQGPAAIKVTSTDRRIALAWANLDDAVRNLSDQTQLFHLQLPFASNDKSQIRIVVSNNGKATTRPAVKIGQAQIYELGATPFVWTHLPRAILRPLQRSIFKTSRMVPLFVAGIFLLLFAKQFRALALLMVVPVYYLSIHSTLHTEFRYILSIHYFLLIFAAVTIYSAGAGLLHAARQSRLWSKRRQAARTIRRK
jgi:hypothetical protein